MGGEKQVVVRLCSGFGNQLFQITCGLALATRWGADLVCDTTWYQLVARIHRPVRQFRLDRLSLPTPEAWRGGRRWTIGLAATIYDRSGRGKEFLEKLGRMSVVHEQYPLRRQKLEGWKNSSRIYLNGYWQTADHFLSVREVLRPMLLPCHGPSAGAKRWLDMIQSQRTCFIHIRRGDYATLVGAAGLLPLEYYHRAVRAMNDIAGGEMHWLIFAEDEAWARQNMTFLPRWQLVSYESADRDIEDLQLMAACDAGIIANSSYSWWGAALGDRPGRLIIAPERYWNTPNSDLTDWVLPAWHRVPAWA
jgi:hypothetical protein